MQRLFISILVFAALLGAISFVLNRNDFQLFSDDSDHQDPIVEISERGIVKSLGIFVVSDSGTHFLQKDNAETLLLLGLGSDLDLYIDKKVEVVGRLTATPSGKELLQVLSIDELEEDSSSEISVEKSADTGWTNFFNGSLGISFQHRKHWALETKNSILTFTLPPLPLAPCEPDTSKNIICPEPKKDFIFIKKISDSETSEKNFPKYKNFTKISIGIDHVIGYQQTLADGKIRVYAPRESFVYILSYEPSEKRFGDPHANDFFQLFGTFRFVPLT